MKRFIVFAFMLVSALTAQAKPLTLLLWHSMAGNLGLQVNKLADGFNSSQSDYVIKPVYKGNYTESLTSFAAAFRAKKPPAMVQVFEVATRTMLTPKGIIKPLDTLLQEQGVQLPESDFFSAIRSYYAVNGKLKALPFNTAIPVLFYNADALAKIGYSADAFPATWDALEKVAGELKKAGYACAYTSAYPGWILLEAYASLHGLPLFNPLSGEPAYDNPAVIRHVTRLKRWQTLHYFEYGGRVDDATTLFTSSRCPIFSQSSGAYKGLSALVNFHLGVAPLPLDTVISKKRHQTLIGGAALWAVSGQSASAYQGIARFYAYIARPAVQELWHDATGYLPLGLSGVYKQREEINHDPVLAFLDNGLNHHDTSLRPLDAHSQIRTINDEALEAIFAGIQSPKEAMQQAMIRARIASSRAKKIQG